MPDQDNQKPANDLVKSLGLAHPPLAIHFSDEALPGVDLFTDDMLAPTEDGRTGRVPVDYVCLEEGVGGGTRRTHARRAGRSVRCSP